MDDTTKEVDLRQYGNQDPLMDPEERYKGRENSPNCPRTKPTLEKFPNHQ
jgi:hypothetical protein